MTLTPQQIQTQEFHVRFRGFDVEEVDAFLENIAAEFTSLTEQNAKLTEQVDSLSKEMSEYQSKGKAFQHAILSAQQIADELKEKSAAEAEAMLTEARNEAEQITESAKTELAALQTEIDRLEKLAAESKSDLQRILNSYLEMISAGPAKINFTDIEPEQEPLPAHEEQAPEDDLSDLYQKIDLPDLTPATISEEDNATEDEDSASHEEQATSIDVEEYQDEEPQPEPVTEDAPYASIPNLDEEVVFDLEDPLDANEPSVDFENLFPKDDK